MDQHMLPVEQQMCLNPALALCQKGKDRAASVTGGGGAVEEAGEDGAGSG